MMKQNHILANMLADQVDAKLKSNSGQGRFRIASGKAVAYTHAKLG